MSENVARNFIQSFIESMEKKDIIAFGNHFYPKRPVFDVFFDKKITTDYKGLVEHQTHFCSKPWSSFSGDIVHFIYDSEEKVCLALVEAKVVPSEGPGRHDVLMVRAHYDTSNKAWFVDEIFNSHIALLS